MVRTLGVIAGLFLLVAPAGFCQSESTPATVELGWTGLQGSWTPSGFIVTRIRPRTPAAGCGLLLPRPGTIWRVLTIDGEACTPEGAVRLENQATASLALAIGPAEHDEEEVIGPCLLERKANARPAVLPWPETSIPPGPRWRTAPDTPSRTNEKGGPVDPP